jgi:hypothetical protein
MLEEPEPWSAVTALEARTHLVELETERASAIASELAGIEAYMSDLDQEIETWRQLYVVSAVTEIAILHGELNGRDIG